LNHPDPEHSRQYLLVSRAIAYIRDHAKAQPSLATMAEALHISPFHLQKLFAEWAGISPKRFLQYLTKEYARQQLLEAQNVLTVSARAGLSSGSRLHDLMVQCEAMTPGEIQAAGRGLEISYGFADSPFGEALLAWTGRGICHFAFATATPHEMVAALRSRWPHAQCIADAAQATQRMQHIFPPTPPAYATQRKLHLLLRGTNFQIKVWEALLQIGPGQCVSYQQLASRAGCPQAQRAVGSALAANEIGFLIPCHRVIRSDGDTGHYRWGAERKRAMLAWEAGQREYLEAPAFGESP